MGTRSIYIETVDEVILNFESSITWGLQPCLLGPLCTSVIICDISQLLASRYPNFDTDTSFQKIGNALNDVQFNFKSKRKTKHMEYWLVEKWKKAHRTGEPLSW